MPESKRIIKASPNFTANLPFFQDFYALGPGLMRSFSLLFSSYHTSFCFGVVRL